MSANQNFTPPGPTGQQSQTADSRRKIQTLRLQYGDIVNLWPSEAQAAYRQLRRRIAEVEATR